MAKLRDKWEQQTAKLGQIAQAANKLKAQLDIVADTTGRRLPYLQSPADPPATGVNLIKNTGVCFMDNKKIRQIYLDAKV